MNCRLLALLPPAALLLAAPLLALPEPTAEELQANRARLERWRQHPERLARLRRDAQAFEALPEARREQAQKLDHDLRELSSAEQARLMNVLERYGRWLRQLPEADRQAVEQAPDKAARLAIIRALRDRDWMQKQPRALREQWAALQGEERSAFVHQLREADRRRHHQWETAARFWTPLENKQPMPARLADLDLPREKDGAGVQLLVHQYLWPMLGEKEKQRLKDAEGHWPAYPRTLVAIADRHPFALPGPHGPRFVSELPLAVQARVVAAKTKETAKVVKQAEGRWPDFAVAVVEFNHKRKTAPLPHELWPCNYQGLLKPMQEYVDKVLIPALTEQERLRLRHADNQWPKYPLTIHELAQAHHLPPPPWQTALPGPRERWDPYRVQKLGGLPELPRLALYDFALYELDPAERARLKLSPGDPASWQRLREAYFKHKHDELNKLRRLDRKLGNNQPPVLLLPAEKLPRSGT